VDSGPEGLDSGPEGVDSGLEGVDSGPPEGAHDGVDLVHENGRRSIVPGVPVDGWN
jgi:hypothetical protein